MKIKNDIFSIIIGEGTDAVDIGAMVDGITNIDRDIGNQWINTYGVGTGRYGSSHEKSQLDKKNISITFIKILPQNEMALWRNDMFSAVDCPNGPRKLVFNDEPNKYYNVLIDGKIDFKYDVGSRTGSGTIQFVVPDGISHSSIMKQLTNTTNDSSIGSITFEKSGNVTVVLNNTGNVDAYPIITIDNKTENDYIGIASAVGVMEIGNKFDADGKSVIDNTNISLLNIKSDDSSDTTGWGQFKAVPNKFEPFIDDFAQNNGKLTYGTSVPDIFGKGLLITKDNFGRLTAKANWYGGLSKFTFPKDPTTKLQITPTDFDLVGVAKFWESKMGQVGIITITVVDKNDVGITNYTIHKSDLMGDLSFVTFRRNIKYPKPVKGDMSWTVKRFGANNNELNNQGNPNRAFNSDKGQFAMSKNGPWLSWTYNGVKETIYAPEVTTAQAAGVYIGIGRMVAGGGGVHLQTMTVNSLSFTAKGVSATKNAPNLFTKGSRNKIDMSSGDIFYMEDPTSTKTNKQNSDLVDGSEAFGFPKGKNTFVISPSLWAKPKWLTNKPNIKITWIENFG